MAILEKLSTIKDIVDIFCRIKTSAELQICDLGSLLNYQDLVKGYFALSIMFTHVKVYFRSKKGTIQIKFKHF